MPSIGYDEYKNESPRIRAWQAHYVAKGCTSTKAYEVALRKAQSSRTWPPK